MQINKKKHSDASSGKTGFAGQIILYIMAFVWYTCIIKVERGCSMDCGELALRLPGRNPARISSGKSQVGAL